ncbi:putative GTP-binding protein EngB [Rickettsiales bacterium Ac37b]|nr:putative GTP-binding protein EngB [Rickettsiales bacterium Ac37b]
MKEIVDKKILHVFAQETVFLAGARKFADIPKFFVPEVAFWGRSNVGKSSLLNFILNRKKLVRVSHTPGRTQQLNFFSLNQKIILVDLPGYGYAKVSKSRIKGWNNLTIEYLEKRTNLKRVYILIDARRSIKEIDMEAMDILDYSGVSYQIVFTKLDKVTDKEREKLALDIENIKAYHSALHPALIFTSARDSIGLEEIRYSIAEFMDL